MRRDITAYILSTWFILTISILAEEPVVFFDVDFGGDTTGQTATAATYVQGVTSTNPTKVSEKSDTSAGPETAWVMTSVGVLTNKPVRFISTQNDSGYPDIVFDSGNNTATSGVIRVEWDYYMNSYTPRTGGAAETIATFYIKGNSGNGVLAVSFSVDADPASGGHLSLVWGNGWDSGADKSWSFNTLYHMIVEIDIDNDTYSIWKNGTQIATDLTLANEKDSYRLFELKDGRGTGGSDGKATIAFDNIIIRTVPPPPKGTCIVIK